MVYIGHIFVFEISI